MRFYLRYSMLCAKKEFAYPLNSIFKMLNRSILLYVQIVIWKAVYNGSVEKINSDYGSISLNMMILYTIFSHVMYSFINNTTITSVNEKIRTGDIVFYLSKPYSFVTYQFTEALSGSVANLLLEGGPLLLISSLLYQQKGVTLIQLLLFISSCLLGWCIFFLLSILCAGLSFWVVQTGPLNFLLDGMIKIFSGSLIPLWLFPHTILNIIERLPFSCIYFVPLTLLTTETDVMLRYSYFTKQIVWVVILLITTKLVFYIGEKKVMVQGG